MGSATDSRCRSEYLYVNFPTWTTFTPGAGNIVSISYPIFLNTKLNNNIWRFGLTCKFGSYAAAVGVTSAMP
jgi:hypothetical protein